MSRLYEMYLSIKDLEILAEFHLLQILYLCTQKSVCTTNFGPFGEIGAIFSVQLSSRTQFAQIKIKKLSPKINVKYIKKIEFRIKVQMSYIARIYYVLQNYTL